MSVQAGQKRGFESTSELISTSTEEGDIKTNVVLNATATPASDETNEDGESQVLKRAKLSALNTPTTSSIESKTASTDESKHTGGNIESGRKHSFDEASYHPPSYVPATLAALPRSAASPGRPAIQNNRNYEPSGAGMRMSVSAILSKSGKEEMYRSKPTVDDQGSRGQSLPPIGQTPNPPSPYSTFHARSSSQPLIENPNQPPRKLSQPTPDKESTPMDTKNRLVQGLLAAAPSSEQPPPTNESMTPKPDAVSNNIHGSTAPATVTPSRDMPTTTPGVGQMFSSTDPTPRRASLGNLMSAHSPLLQQPHRRGSLDSGAPHNKSTSLRETMEEEEGDDDMPLRMPKLIIKNDLVWKSLEGKPEKSLGVFVYEPGVQLPVLEGQENATLEVRIPCWFLTYDNKMVKKRALWGTDIYTDDTDIVAMIIHTGKYEAMYHEPEVKLNNDVMLAMSGTAALIEPRRVGVNTNIPDHDLSVTLRVLPKLQRYAGTIRHHLKSRDWGSNHDGMSLFVEKVEQLPRGEARSKGRAALKSGLFAYQDLRRRAITNEKGQSTSDGSFADEEDSNDNDMNRNRGVRKKIKMFQMREAMVSQG